MSSRKCCSGAGGLAPTPPQGSYRGLNYHRLASKYPSLQYYIIIRSSWPINIIIIFVPTPPPPPTTIASTVTLGHVGLYHYRICWHSPHNSIFSSTTSLPSEECYREPNDHRLSSKFSSHYLHNLTILTTILTTTSSRLSKVYPLYHPYFRPTFCSESRQPIPITFLPSLTTYRHTCKCLSREKQLLFYLTTISLFAF